MSSVSGLSSSTTSNLQGYGGLASGLDRDSLIESMTYATQSKIDQQEQLIDKLEWEQEAYRGITDMMHDFQEKYLSYTSSSNLLSSVFFSQNVLGVTGAFSDLVSVSGSANSGASSLPTILGVKSLAENAKYTKGDVSENTLSTGSIPSSATTNLIEGNTIIIEYGTVDYKLELKQGEGYKYGSMEEIAASINKLMAEIDTPDGELSSVVSVSESGGILTFSDKNSGGKSLSISGGTGNVLQNLGFVAEGESLDSEGISFSGGTVSTTHPSKLTETKTNVELLSNATLTFEYNGKSETITLDEYAAGASLETITADLQTKLDDAFGRGRISVNLDSATNQLNFKTTIPSGGEDVTSTLSITGGSSGLMGEEGLLGVAYGESNRLNVYTSIADSGLFFDAADTTGNLVISNNGKTLDLTAEHGLTWDSSINSILEAINEDGSLGIEIKYQKETDAFVVNATEEGASGVIDLGGNLSNIFFGGETSTPIYGKDAEIYVQYEGASSPTLITRGDNSFSVDGVTVEVSGTFGFDEAGNYIEGTEKVSMTAEGDAEKVTEVVKGMVDAYNEMLKLINEEVNTKYDRDYPPLTDAQRSEMSESEIENWEEKAKEGLLYNDSTLRTLSSDLRFILPLSLRDQFEEIGITVSSEYSDNGKLIFDEAKFTAAFSEDPEKVQELFNGDNTSTDGSTTSVGFMSQLDTIIDRYAGMTGSSKGLLVEKAGSTHAPTTIVQNYMQEEIDNANDALERLLDQLETEQDRYISEFTALETLISEMNSQSSYLSSMFSY